MKTPVPMLIKAQCLAFGRELLRTGDLDPLYVMLYTANLPRKTLGRFILAYSMFYHAGVAARCAEAASFWRAVEIGIQEKWPRGTERRHWRGKIAQGTWEDFSRRNSTPESILRDWALLDYSGQPTFPQVFKAVQKYSGYGPWIAFKIADLFERTGYVPVDFAGADLSIYRDPSKGAALYRFEDQTAPIPARAVAEVIEELVKAFASYKAPPIYDRPVNVQEAETILCKFKSHYNGHYPMGKDTREILHALDGWGDLAKELSQCPLL